DGGGRLALLLGAASVQAAPDALGRRVQAPGRRGKAFHRPQRRPHIERIARGLLDPAERLPQFGRGLPVIEREDRRGAPPPQGERVHLRVAVEVRLVDLVQRVFGGVPPPPQPAVVGGAAG